MALEQASEFSQQQIRPHGELADRYAVLQALSVLELQQHGAFDPDNESARQQRVRFRDALPTKLNALETIYLGHRVAEKESYDPKLHVQFLVWLGSTCLGYDDTTAKSARYALWDRRSVRATIGLAVLELERLTSY